MMNMLFNKLLVKMGASRQEGGIGRYTSLSYTTKRRIKTNFKTKINQKFQKIKPQRSPTTKELKKKHSSSLVGGAETRNRGGEDKWQGSGWQTGWSHIHMWVSWEDNWGARQVMQPRVPVQVTKA